MRGRSARGINRNRSVAYRRQALPNSLTMTNMAAASIRIWSMAFFVRRAFHISSASWLLLCGMGGSAMSQDAAPPPSSTQLPEITVTSPSPIVRRNVVPSRTPARIARAVPGRNRERTPQAQPTPVAAAPQRGVLPIVTDQFATVTVVPNEEIRREGGATLGDLLFSKPGITGSSFSPGASSRPIIRGLGVVSAPSNRIPDALPSCAAAPCQTYGLPVKAPLASVESPSCVTVETRTAVSSVDRGVEGGILLDAGGGNFAVHADAYGRKTSDYNIPGYTYLLG